MSISSLVNNNNMAYMRIWDCSNKNIIDIMVLKQ